MNIENYDNSNIININEHNKFHDSHIVIKGKNNIVEIGHCKHLIQKLTLLKSQHAHTSFKTLI